MAGFYAQTDNFTAKPFVVKLCLMQACSEILGDGYEGSRLDIFILDEYGGQR